MSFIEDVKDDLRRLPWGPAFLNVLDQTGVPIEEMPEECQLLYPNSPALLLLTPQETILATDIVTEEDISHEIRHVEQVLRFPEALSRPSDIKHHYIYHAFSEGDAYAHQAAVFVQSLRAGRRDMDGEREIFERYKANDPMVRWEPVRGALYRGLEFSPDNLVDGNLPDWCEEDLKGIMFQVFAWSFQFFVPYQYERRHLSGIIDTMRRADEIGVSFDSRLSPMEALTDEDIAYFVECVKEFGACVHDLDETYLVNRQGMGPDYDDYLAPLFTPNAVRQLNRLNALIPQGDVGIDNVMMSEM